MTMSLTYRMMDELKRFGFTTLDIDRAFGAELMAQARKFHGFSPGERVATLADEYSGVLGYYPSEREAPAIEVFLPQRISLFDDSQVRGYSSYDVICNTNILGASRVFGNNHWPTAKQDFARDVQQAYDTVADIMRRLSLDVLDAARLSTTHGAAEAVASDQCCSMLRLLKYDEGHTGLSKVHTDFELLSFVFADQPGLEVFGPDRIWRDAPVGEGLVTILAGDMMELLSDGDIQSSPHRVRSTGTERHSVVFFQGLPLDFVLPPSALDLPETFGQHIIGMCAAGAPHLIAFREDIERRHHLTMPQENPFKVKKLGHSFNPIPPHQHQPPIATPAG